MSDFAIFASGGIGNRLNALATAIVYNVPLFESPAQDGPHFHDIFDEDIYAYVPKYNPNSKPKIKPAWQFPGLIYDKLGTDEHYKNHEKLNNYNNLTEFESKHWRMTITSGLTSEQFDRLNIVKNLKFKLEYRKPTVVADRIGIALRLLHPRLKFLNPSDDILVNKINELYTNYNNIILVSDRRLTGIDSNINYLTCDMIKDKLNRDNIKAMNHWTELRSCSEIYRTSYMSTFTSWHCFIDGIQMHNIQELF